MDSIIAAMKLISLLFLVLLLLDLLTGNLWMNFVTRAFGKLSELMLSGAVIELYHEKVSNILGWADRYVGHFIPKWSVFLGLFLMFFGLSMLGGLTQAIQENIPLAEGFFYWTLAFSFSSTISTAFCYTITYLVLHLIQQFSSFFVWRYIYLVCLEIIVSYIMVAVGYASPVLIHGDPASSWVSGEMSAMEARLRFLGFILSTWPYSVVDVVFTQISDFQSSVNGILLMSSMVFCVLPTVFHVMILIVDILRFFSKRICEELMYVFDKLARKPKTTRRVFWGVISTCSAIGWIIE